ncbi:MAG: VTT domain-containing protein [Pseudomonadota bacterium]
MRALRLAGLRLTRAARGRWALPALYLGSVIESSVLPWPIEFPLLAEMLRGRGHVFPAAIAVILGSVTGCLISFGVGAAAFGLVAPLLTETMASDVAGARTRIEDAGVWAVFVGMMTPVPVQFTSFAAGLAGVGFAGFVIAVTVGRSIRYMSMAVLVFLFGEEIMAWWRRRPPLLRRISVALFVIAFIAVLVWTGSGLAGG